MPKSGKFVSMKTDSMKIYVLKVYFGFTFLLYFVYAFVYDVTMPFRPSVMQVLSNLSRNFPKLGMVNRITKSINVKKPSFAKKLFVSCWGFWTQKGQFVTLQENCCTIIFLNFGPKENLYMTFKSVHYIL